MIDYRRVEGILYKHYQKKNRIDRLRGKLIRIENRISRLKDDIMNCNIELNDTLKGIDYSGSKVQTSNSMSEVELELERALTKLINDLQSNIREKYKVKSKIQYLEKQIDDLEIILCDLSEEELQMLELKYYDKNSWSQIAERLLCSIATIYRRRDKVFSFINNEFLSKIKSEKKMRKS